MWGDNDETPIPAASKYRKYKSHLGKNTYFGPETNDKLPPSVVVK